MSRFSRLIARWRRLWQRPPAPYRYARARHTEACVYAAVARGLAALDGAEDLLERALPVETPAQAKAAVEVLLAGVGVAPLRIMRPRVQQPAPRRVRRSTTRHIYS